MKLEVCALSEIYAPIQRELDGLPAILKAQLQSDDALIRSIHNHILSMTGKYLRPALVLLCALSGKQPQKDKAMGFAAAVELIHTATLVHDDIIDDSDTRRNQPTLRARWGRDLSIVAGDYLYAKAFLLVAALEDRWLTRALSECAHVLCEGEMKQIEKRGQAELTERDYLDIIDKKTASLFQLACAGGAYFSGCNRTDIGCFAEYGRYLGMGFQIADDCLDLAGESDSLGKGTGLDLNKNDRTLPLLYLLESLSETERRSLLHTLQVSAAGSLEAVRTLAVEKKAIERAMEKARTFARQAQDAVRFLPEGPCKMSLQQLAVFCVDRSR